MAQCDTIFRKQDDETTPIFKSSTFQHEKFEKPIPIAKYLLTKGEDGIYTITTGFKVDLSRLPLNSPIVTSARWLRRLKMSFQGTELPCAPKRATSPLLVKSRS
jgi:hypothetical protein